MPGRCRKAISAPWAASWRGDAPGDGLVVGDPDDDAPLALHQLALGHLIVVGHVASPVALLRGLWPSAARWRKPRSVTRDGGAWPKAIAAPRSSACGERFLDPAHHQAAVGAAEAEAVGHHRLQRLVRALAQDRQVGEGRVEVLDVGALGGEAVVAASAGSRSPPARRPRPGCGRSATWSTRSAAACRRTPARTASISLMSPTGVEVPCGFR